jgi:hypothetical protein
MIRAFDLRDFPTLHRNRNHGLCLDTGLALTRSMTLVPAGALLATLAPATGIFTYVVADDAANQNLLVGQFMHAAGSSYAKLTFITPESQLDSTNALTLLDYLAQIAGERGAFNLLAEVDERSIAYEVLRRAGYAIYTRQRNWELTEPAQPPPNLWLPAHEDTENVVQRLYHELVPALVQQTEPPPWEKINGLIHAPDEDLVAYVHLSFGPRGILAQPFIRPDAENVEQLLSALYASLPGVRARRVYLCVRSHQAWLGPFLDELGYNSGPPQAVMVKRLVKTQKITLPIRIPAGLETVKPEIPSSGFEPTPTSPQESPS